MRSPLTNSEISSVSNEWTIRAIFFLRESGNFGKLDHVTNHLAPSSISDHAISVAGTAASAAVTAAMAFLAAGALLGAATGFLTSRLLSRARSPAPVPVAFVATATAVSWLATIARWISGALPAAWLSVCLALTAIAIPLTTADLCHRRLPDVLTLPAYPILAMALAFAATASPGLALRAAAGAFLFGGLHLLVHALSRHSLGAGDVKIAAPLGAVLGAVGWGALVAAGVLAALVTLGLSTLRRYRDGVPHGPGLLLATCLVAAFRAPGGQVGMGP